MHAGDGNEHHDRYHALCPRLPSPCGDGGRVAGVLAPGARHRGSPEGGVVLSHKLSVTALGMGRIIRFG